MRIKRLKILLIDEVKLLREMEKTFLKREKFQILLAENGSEVLQKTKKEKPDLIVLDVKMPHIDGLTCGRRIKANPDTCNVPILLIASEQEKKLCRQTDFDDFIEKPVTRENLIKCISKFLIFENRQSERVPLTRKIYCLKKDQSEFELYSKNISKNGIFLKNKDPLSKGSLVEMKFSLKSKKSDAICATGEVVRIIEDQKDSHLIPGMGMHFKKIKQSDQCIIDDYIEKTLQSGFIA